MTSFEFENIIQELEIRISDSPINNTPLGKDILSLMENFNSINSEKDNEIKKLNNIIKEQKGEQPVPSFDKKGKSSDISSTNELSEAEKALAGDDNKDCFKLTKGTIEKLKETEIPEDILEKLKELKSNKYETKKAFHNDIIELIGQEEFDKYKTKLEKFAYYKKRIRKPKKPDIHIDRTVICHIDETLPDDATNVGFQDNIVQDIEIKTDNVFFRKEKFYSPSEKKTYIAKAPAGYEGEFGPGIKSQIFFMKYVNNMSEPKICSALNLFDITISNGYISKLLTEGAIIDGFHNEKNEIYKLAMKMAEYVGIDDTGSCENGVNKYVQILSHPQFSLFFTTPKKDRLTIIDLLRFFKKREFIFNQEAFDLLKKMNVSEKKIQIIKDKTNEKNVIDEKEMEKILNDIFSKKKTGKVTRLRIKEAGLIAFYHQETDTPIMNVFIADDAPQFKLITLFLGLCWVHEWRHYKKLKPVLNAHKKDIEAFRKVFWSFYTELAKYKTAPNIESSQILKKKFDDIFSMKYSYKDLQNRIDKTKLKKTELLTVLEKPQIPLHNNSSENGARLQKRREDVSLQTKSKNGTKAKDTMLSMIETCRKQSYNSLQYIREKIINPNLNPLLNFLDYSFNSS
jgi:hypothetical protein